MPTFQGVVSEDQVLAADRVHQVAEVRPAPPPQPQGEACGPGPSETTPARAVPGLTRSAGSQPKSSFGPGRISPMETVAALSLPKTHYLNAEYGIKSWLLTTDHKRIAILYLISITFFFTIGGVLRRHDPAGAADAGRRPGIRRHLQQAVHDARHHDDLLLPDPVDPGGARQLPRADDDRRPRPGASRRSTCSSWYLYILGGIFTLVRDHRPAASTPAGRSTRRSARMASNTNVLTDGDRRLHRRLLVDPDGPELHRHHPPDARARA